LPLAARAAGAGGGAPPPPAHALPRDLVLRPAPLARATGGDAPRRRPPGPEPGVRHTDRGLLPAGGTPHPAPGACPAHRVRVRAPRRPGVPLERGPTRGGCPVPAALLGGAPRGPCPVRAPTALPARGGEPEAAQEPGAPRADRRAAPPA